MEKKQIKDVLKDFDKDEVVEYVEDELKKLVFDDDGDVLDYVKDSMDKHVFDDEDEIVEYVEMKMDKIVRTVDEINDYDDCGKYNHPRDYITGKDELREHLIQILGLGHYVTNEQIILEIQNILK